MITENQLYVMINCPNTGEPVRVRTIQRSQWPLTRSIIHNMRTPVCPHCSEVHLVIEAHIFYVDWRGRQVY